MSQFSGPCGRGAMRRRRLEKQIQAAERDAYGEAVLRDWLVNVGPQTRKTRRGRRAKKEEQ